MVLFTSGSSLNWRGISRCHMRHLPQVFAFYLPLTINLLCLYRDITMTEYEFFIGRDERWGDNMKALWGCFSICPLLSHIDLPYHTVGELLSISHLKVWGDTQKPHGDMAYLFIRVEDSSEGEGYSLALVCISPQQARVPTMEEALGILSTCTSNGLDWPYVFIQSYEGANHVPLPKDKHLSVLSQGSMESPCGQISLLEVCQFLSAGPWVIYPVGLNRDDQPATFTYQDHFIAALVSPMMTLLT